MRWLILLVTVTAVTGCGGSAYYQLKPGDNWGTQRMHDYEWHCRGGDDPLDARVQRCMAEKGYVRAPLQ